jgi:hypothetical protein
VGAVRETVAEHRKNRTPAAGAGAGAAQAAGGAARLSSRVARLYGRTEEVGSNPSAELCQVHAENQRGRFFADVCPEPVLANDRVSEDELKERRFFLLTGRNRAGQAHDLGSFLRSALYPRAQVRKTNALVSVLQFLKGKWLFAKTGSGRTFRQALSLAALGCGKRRTGATTTTALSIDA